jgi:ATP-dependent RNA helicase DeaD
MPVSHATAAVDFLNPLPSGSADAPNGFDALGLSPKLLSALRRMKFHTPTDIQRELIPHALRGEDCIGQAKTGTGKTAAFALPMLDRITAGGGLQGLVLVPTRELASQVDDHFKQFCADGSLRTALIFGGRRMNTQVDQLRQGVEVVIGTPGRILDLMRRRLLDARKFRIVVLDEVDRMLDIGFRDDIRRILRAIEGGHQTIFVSATIDEEINKLARTFMRTPVEVNVSHDTLTVDNIVQGFVTVDPRDKFQTLVNLLRAENPTLAIVFTNTKHAARRVAERLTKEGVNCKEIHGDLVQSRREKVMASFRKAHIQVLVATDLASRGLDVMEVSHIVNYDLPEDAAVYVHRIGRTARMGQKGYAVSFVAREEGKLLTTIEMLINKEIPQLDPDWLVKHHAPLKKELPPPVEALPVQAYTPAGNGKSDEGAKSIIPARLREVLRKDEIIEAWGIKPIPRTLGSRFRSARKFRK